MKPMRVDVGEHAPDVDELIEKANNMEEMLMKVAELKDDSQMRNITGVEEARMSHYWTNQDQVEEGIESVANKGALSETVSFDTSTNPHQTGSTLSAHENNAGGIKKSVGVQKAGLMDLLGGKKPPMGGPDGPPMGGPDGPPDGPPGMDDKPGGLPKLDMEDGDDAEALGEKIKSLVDELVDKTDDGKPKLPMPKPPMGGGGPPGAGGPPPGMPPMGGGGGPPMM